MLGNNKVDNEERLEQEDNEEGLDGQDEEAGNVEHHVTIGDEEPIVQDYFRGDTPEQVVHAPDPHDNPESVTKVVESVVGAVVGQEIEEEANGGFHTPENRPQLEDEPEHFLDAAERSAHEVTQLEKSNEINERKRKKGKGIPMQDNAEPSTKKMKSTLPSLVDGKTRPSKLDWTFVRQRRKAAALCSPFLDNEKRGENYDAFKKSFATRNVGTTNVVGADWFLAIEDITKELSTNQMEAYLCCLHSFPSYAEVKQPNKKFGVMSMFLMEEVYDVWLHYHSGEDITQCNPDVEEAIGIEHLYELSRYVYGEKPRWKRTKKWWKYDKIVSSFIGFNGWATYELDFQSNAINIYDPASSKYKDDDIQNQKDILIPMSRVLPQLLSYSGFYDARPELRQKNQWDINMIPKHLITVKNTKGYMGGSYALKTVECILSRKFPTTFNKKDMEAHRKMVAKAIFKFSTCGPTQPQVPNA